MKKVLVTGASGYLGGRLCHALLRQGHSVRAFVRRTSDLSSLPPLSHDGALDFAYGDVTDYQSLLQACSGCQIILHAAAIVEPWLPDPSKFFSVSSTSQISFVFTLIEYLFTQKSILHWILLVIVFPYFLHWIILFLFFVSRYSNTKFWINLIEMID